MSTYNEGDLIEAVKGETKIVGRIVAEPGDASVLFVEGVGMGTNSLRYHGFTLTVLEKAAPPVPTEPGIYLDKDDDIWDMRRTDRGLTLYPGDAPFTRLEPVPVTVQKVIDHLVGEGCTGWLVEGVRKHFGLTS